MTAPASALPGSTLSVSTTFTNGAMVPVRNAVTALTVPSGWTATAKSPASFTQVGPGQKETTTWSVTVPADATGGAAALSATTTYTGSDRRPPATDSATVNIGYSTLAAARDTVGVSDDADPTAGNLDGSGYSYSAQALASVGVTPGSTVTSGTTKFTWPDVPAAKPDAVTTAGQLVAMNGSGTSLSLLGAGSNGTQSGPLTVTYTDGTTSKATVTFADWYANQAVDGCTLVVTTPHWNRPAGSTQPADHQVSLYAATVPLTTGKQIASLTLPNNDQLHIFATTIN